jgi:dephospho-CoA kinase
MALKPQTPLRIALTGGIACGKSLFAKFLRELGVQTLDADDIVHELIPAEERRRLAPVVFADPAARKALEARIHPLVRERIEEWFSADASPHTLNGPDGLQAPVLKVAIIPLLFECKWDGDYDIILCISSPVSEQLRRMVETRGMTRAQAEARLNAQLPQDEKSARSHYVVVNDSTPEHLREEAVRCVAWLKTR